MLKNKGYTHKLLERLFANPRIAVVVWILLAILVFSLAYQQTNLGLNLESNILKLLPEGEQDPVVERAFEQFAEKNMQRVVFLVTSKNKKQAIQSATELANKLGASSKIEEVTFEISNEEQQSTGKFNFAYRHHLISDKDKRRLVAGDFDDFSDEAIQQIYSPFSGGLVELVDVDPLLLSYRLGLSQDPSSNKSSRKQSSLKLDGQYLIALEDERYYVLLSAKLKNSPFAQATQQELNRLISVLENQWSNQVSLDRNLSATELIKTGAIFYASYGYQVAKGEISTIGLGSLLLIIGLVLVVFVSFRPILLVSLALFFGISTGFIIVHILFGQVHLLTLVFGASLIGVAVDYAFHYFSVDESSGQPSRIRQIFPAVSLGLFSSVIGYLALLTTPFPGLQQMAVFCVLGLSGAYLTVVLLFPVIRLTNHTPLLFINLCRSILDFGATSLSIGLWRSALLLPLIAAALFILAPHENDDIRQFQTINQQLKQHEETVKRIVNAPAANQFYLVKEKSPEALLVQLEKTTQYLDTLVGSNIIESYQSVSQWLPSRQRQQRNYALYEKLYQSSVFDPLLSLGIVTQTDVDKTRELFKDDQSQWLTAERWLSSPVGKQFSYLWLGKIDDDFAAVISLVGINRLQALESFDQNSLFVDKVSQVSNLFGVYRHKASQLLLVAISLIFIILLIRYGLRKALIITSSPVIAISMTIIGLVLFGVSLNLFNTLALFLVIGIGIDYGLFFAESKEFNPHILLAILLSALTTIFSFGLLALSETAAIHAFGLTMLIGISTAFILSPIIGHLVTRLDKTNSGIKITEND